MEISLALGGGGAKGNAHIGVLRVLDREGFKVKALAGTSAGGLIGALYMAGYSPDQILERFTRIDQGQFFGHSEGEQPSLLGLSGMAKFLYEMLGECTFGELNGHIKCVSKKYYKSMTLFAKRYLFPSKSFPA